MAMKRKTVRRTSRAAVRNTRGRLARTWEDTREVLGASQAAVEKQLRHLVKRSGVEVRGAGEALTAWRRRLVAQRRKTMKQFEGRLLVLQSRARKERRAAGRMVDDAVRGALAALNIPSRQEVHELTRRVEELSRKIDGFRRAPRRRVTTSPVPVATA